MATNMEKITKALVRYGLSDVNGIAEVTKISKPAIYKLAAQNNASFTLSNGIMVLKEEHKAMDDAKEGTVNKECEKEHWPDYLRLKDGTAFTKVEKDITVSDIVPSINIMLEGGMTELTTAHLNAVAIVCIKELKKRKEGEK